jgi:hypothetical protein
VPALRRTPRPKRPGRAERVGADQRDDMLYLFWPELLDVASGQPYSAELRSLVAARRQYFEHWHARRSEMPKVLGTVPAAVEDPALIEIFGINPGSLRAMRNPDAAQGTTLTGVAAAKGQATGIARVLQSSDELHRLAPGEVLVCESTSPNWTPAFGKIAGAVCDGGMLTTPRSSAGSTGCRRSPRSAWPRWPSLTVTQVDVDAATAG